MLNRNKIKGRNLCTKRSNIIGISVVSAAIITRSLFLFFEFWRRIEDGKDQCIWYLILIFVSDMIAFLGYSSCVYLITVGLRTLKHLISDEQLGHGFKMNFAAARLHRLIVLLFWVPQLIYDLMTYYTVLDILINHKQEVANRK